MTRRSAGRDIQAGIQQVLEMNGEDRYQWGQYVERNDGDEGWTPLIYEGDEKSVRDWFAADKDSRIYRNSRIVRRAIGPWEVRE